MSPDQVGSFQKTEYIARQGIKPKAWNKTQSVDLVAMAMDDETAMAQGFLKMTLEVFERGTISFMPGCCFR